ncbi:hypothetical protein GWK47_007304 [Chionoecetes opilio]|uniref:Uncharacterized protein n=1 Tax=Chionoecetes opilio TaxID=41210 RepID=A0A8J5CSP2_CHIOP|nr:hypothetical protein GWK47_007304 [Chionoecetes opilio]
MSLQIYRLIRYGGSGGIPHAVYKQHYQTLQEITKLRPFSSFPRLSRLYADLHQASTITTSQYKNNHIQPQRLQATTVYYKPQRNLRELLSTSNTASNYNIYECPSKTSTSFSIQERARQTHYNQLITCRGSGGQQCSTPTLPPPQKGDATLPTAALPHQTTTSQLYQLYVSTAPNTQHRSSHHVPPQHKQHNNQPHPQLNTLKQQSHTTPFKMYLFSHSQFILLLRWKHKDMGPGRWCPGHTQDNPAPTPAAHRRVLQVGRVEAQGKRETNSRSSKDQPVKWVTPPFTLPFKPSEIIDFPPNANFPQHESLHLSRNVASWSSSSPRVTMTFWKAALGLAAAEQGIPRRLLLRKPPVYLAHVFGERDSELGGTHKPPQLNKSVNDFTATTTSARVTHTPRRHPLARSPRHVHVKFFLFTRRS